MQKRHLRAQLKVSFMNNPVAKRQGHALLKNYIENKAWRYLSGGLNIFIEFIPFYGNEEY